MKDIVKLESQLIPSLLEVKDTVAPEWRTIDALNEKFKDLTVHLTESPFNSNKWDFSKAAMEPIRIYFDSVLPKDSPCIPMRLMIKLVGYYLCKGHGRVEYAALTAGHTLRYANRLANWLSDQNILVGHTGSYFRPASSLTSDDFKPFFQDVAHHSISSFQNYVRFLSIWYHLSLAGKLPIFMSLTCDPFSGKSIVETYNEVKSTLDEDDDIGWNPIPLRYAFQMTKKALVLTEDNKGEVLKVYELFMELYDKAPEKKLCSGNPKSAKNFPYKPRNGAIRILKTGRAELFENLPKELHDTKGELSPGLMRLYLQRAQAAALIIVMITTGLRNWEVRNLKVGCVTPDPVIPGAYRLQATIKKTARSKSRGKVVSLPIPHSTKLAVNLLETMRFHADELDHQYLLVPSKNVEYTKDDTRVSVDTLTSRLTLFCEYSEIGYIPHPHQFRKTIAGYFGLNSKLALLMIMRLFSHSSAEMSALYLRNNPLISEARQQLLLDAAEQLLDPIVEGMQLGKIAGPMATQIKDRLTLNGSKSLTSEELGQTVGELIREHASVGHTHVQATPFALCIFSVNSSEKPPCAKFGSPCSQDLCDIEVLLQELAGNAPNISRCIGLGCSQALSVEMNKTNITVALEHYRDVLEDAEYTDNIYLVDEARNFIEIHEPALEVIS